MGYLHVSHYAICRLTQLGAPHYINELVKLYPRRQAACYAA
jgi:hypothetical protein